MLPSRYSEEQWLEINSPGGLVTTQRHLFKVDRFHFLFLHWGNRIRHHLVSADQVFFNSVQAWLKGAEEVPAFVDMRNIRNRFRFDNPSECVKNANWFADAVECNELLLACAYAAKSVADDFPEFEPLEIPLPPPSIPGMKRNTAELDRRVDLHVKESYRRVEWWEKKKQHESDVIREFCNQFRDVAGNPFRPITLNPRWLTDNVTRLAQTIDETGHYHLMPILADALLEADCDSVDVLKHCREETVHVRGCWVIDLLLGRM